MPTSQPSSSPTSVPTFSMNVEISFTTSQTLSGSNLNATALLMSGTLESETVKRTIADLISIPVEHIAIIGVASIGERRRLSDLRIDFEIVTTTQDVAISDAGEAFEALTNGLKEHTTSIDGGGVTLFESQLRVWSIQIAQEMGKNMTEAAKIFSDVTSTESDVPTMFTQQILRTASPSSTPTSLPTCGLGSHDLGKGSGCEECPPGSYRSRDEVHGDKECKSCPLDSYSDVYGNAECDLCLTPAATIAVGSISCDAFSLRGSTATIIATYVLITVAFGFATYMARSDKVAFAVLSFFPLLDFMSDVLYVLEVRFYNEYVFIAAIICLFLSSGTFCVELFHAKAIPQFLINFPQVIWLEVDIEKLTPIVLGNGVGFEKDDDLLKLIARYAVLWPLVITSQLAWIALFVVWILLHCVIWVPLLITGLFLFQLKGMCVKEIYITWMRLWAGAEVSDKVAAIRGKKDYADFPVDAGMMNESILSEFFFESIPQLLLQALNNTATDQWDSTITLFSFFFSLTVIINSLYRFGYYVLYAKYDIKVVDYAIFLPSCREDGKCVKKYELKRPKTQKLELLQYTIHGESEAEVMVCNVWYEVLDFMRRKARAKDFDAVRTFMDIIIEYQLNTPLKLASRPTAITNLNDAFGRDVLSPNLKFLATSVKESNGKDVLKSLVDSKEPQLHGTCNQM